MNILQKRTNCVLMGGIFEQKVRCMAQGVSQLYSPAVVFVGLLDWEFAAYLFNMGGTFQRRWKV